ncbi:MAG: RimK family alpha-L-glutamate ligase [Vulcanimicrobiota bacterium]
MRLALVTCAEFGLIDDDQFLVKALEARGLFASPVVWTGPIDWSGYAAALVRTPWDYQGRLQEFLAFSRSVPVPLWHSPELIAWNASKTYLLELIPQVPVVPTLLDPDWDEVPWDEVVVKPVVGASARGLVRLRRGQPLPTGLVQPYLPSVACDGEFSLIFLDGRFTHAIRKQPAAGDFRVQEHLGGRSLPALASPTLIAQAEAVLACIEPTLYARVDFLPGPQGWLLSELELIEPELFFRCCPQAAEVLADGIAARLAGGCALTA